MSLCKHCISGVTHEGEPTGTYSTINDVKVYIATPTVEYQKDKALIFLTDVFGVELVNSRLLADDFAKNGFHTVLIDLFNGDPVPADALNPGSSFSLQDWFPNHAPASKHVLVEKVIAGLKEQGVTKFATTGFCYGARLGFDFAFKGETHVTVANHPSLLQVPADLEKYATTKAPLLINPCTVDTQFPHEAQAKADEILGDGKFPPGYKREYWDGCTHGFAVRGDLSDPKVKAGKEGAFKASVEFLIQHL